MSSIRVLIAEDHPLVRTGLCRLAEQEPGLTLVGDASDGPSTVQCAEEMQPDVVLLDAHMPGLTTVEMIEKIRRRAPAVRVVVMSACSAPTFAEEMLKAGAAGFLPKEDLMARLSDVIRAAAAAADHHHRRDGLGGAFDSRNSRHGEAVQAPDSRPKVKRKRQSARGSRTEARRRPA
jgi:DNA-binding NarL/FixJ family response regulator